MFNTFALGTRHRPCSHPLAAALNTRLGVVLRRQPLVHHVHRPHVQFGEEVVFPARPDLWPHGLHVGKCHQVEVAQEFSRTHLGHELGHEVKVSHVTVLSEV